MKTKAYWAVAVLASLVLGFAIGAARAEDEDDPQAMVRRWLEKHKPGEAQRRLAGLVGAWDIEFSVQSGTGPMSGKGKAFIKSACDGRFVLWEESTEAGSFKSSGISLLGHDNVSARYQMATTTSSSTHMDVSEGGGSEDGKSIVLEGELLTPMGPMQGRQVITFVGKDELKAEVFSLAGDQPAALGAAKYRRAK
jgi:hypothetical protein